MSASSVARGFHSCHGNAGIYQPTHWNSFPGNCHPRAGSDLHGGRSNLGTVTATGVTVTDVLPVTLEPVSATSTQGNCAGHQTVTCNLDDIAVFQMLQLR